MAREEIIRINETVNFIQTGYKKIFCNSKNAHRLSKDFPKLTFTIDNYVEENSVVFSNIEKDNELCPHGYDWDDCPDCRH